MMRLVVMTLVCRWFGHRWEGKFERSGKYTVVKGLTCRRCGDRWPR